MTEREPISCPDCGGYGLVKTEQNEVYDCPICQGWGWIEADRPLGEKAGNAKEG